MLQRTPALRTRRSAFTLLEMLVVVAIIVVLAGVGAFYLLPRGEEAKEKLVKSNLAGLTEQCGIFYTNNDRFPQSLEELYNPPQGQAPYIKAAAAKDPWGHIYQYDASGQNNRGMHPDIWCERPNKRIGNWDE